jgi:hypothetical protein
MLRSIRIRALLIALFAFYVAPLLALTVLMSVPNLLGVETDRIPLWLSPLMLSAAWFLAIAPVCSGYFAAKLAQQQPLLHGLLVGIVGAAAVALLGRSDFLVLELVLPLIVVSSGLFGGWLWRYRNVPRDAGL